MVQPAQIYCFIGTPNVSTWFQIPMIATLLTLCSGEMLK